MGKELSLSDRLWYGKYKGLTVGQIIKKDHTWLTWAMKETKFFTLDKRAQTKLDDKTEKDKAEAKEREEKRPKYVF